MIEEREFQVIWEHGVREALKRRINLVHFFPDTASIYISLSNELVCIAYEWQTFLLAHRRCGKFRESLSGDESEQKRLPFVGYGVHGGCLYLPQFMSELLTRFYFRVNCFRLKHFFK